MIPDLVGISGCLALEPGQQIQRPLVIGAGPDIAVQRLHRFEIVIEYIGRRVRENFERPVDFSLAPKIRNQDFNPDAGIRSLTCSMHSAK